MGLVILVYGVIAYLVFFGTFLYLIAFIGGDMTAFVHAPKTLDWGPSPIEGAPAALVNIGLLLLFAVQHTLTARQGFKTWLMKIIPPAAERSTYVLLSSLLIIALYVYWIPMPQVVWQADAGWDIALTVLFFIGFGLVLLATFLINHFELFGLEQTWYRFQGREAPTPKFHTPLLYQHVRHPLYLGWMIAFWSTPMMTVGHLLFAAVWTIYIFVAVGYEERDLVRLFGDKYRQYMARVPMILPFGRRKDG